MRLKFRPAPAVCCFLLVCQSVFAAVYTVRPNDTLWGIARRFHITVDLIVKINDLMGTKLKVGQKIAVPERILDYRVQPGDNLTRIAKANDSSVPAIILLNNLSGETVFAGMTLRVPVITENRSANAKSSQPVATPPSRRKALVHRVQKGDTLTGLSERYSVSIREIMAWNGKKSDSILTGEHLRIHTDPPVRMEERITAVSEKSPPKPVSWISTGVYQFPIDRGSVDRMARSGRGMIFYVDGRTQVKSMGQGVVEYAGPLTGYNQIVIVNYGNEERAVYGFLTGLSIREGQNVLKGQTIGSVEQVSYSPKIQFYLELRKGKNTVDVPEAFPFLKSVGPLAAR